MVLSMSTSLVAQLIVQYRIPSSMCVYVMALKSAKCPFDVWHPFRLCNVLQTNDVLTGVLTHVSHAENSKVPVVPGDLVSHGTLIATAAVAEGMLHLLSVRSLPSACCTDTRTY